MPPPILLIILRFSGVLLVLLGLLHLAVTAFIAHMVQRGAAVDAIGWMMPPMLLNHIVVGILLLPPGILIFYAAPHAAAADRWALIVSRIITVAVAMLPPVLFVLVGTRYFGAVLFRVAAGVVCIASLTLLIAAFWPASAGLPSMRRDSAK